MINRTLSRTLRTLGLSAMLSGAVAAPSLAEGFYVPGPTAFPAAPLHPASRTPLAAESGRLDDLQTFLLLSGATGGYGQHG